ncbi:proline-rich receptor-like protein kinase PERK8 isoform X2 [Phragmites australis]|uniref:proline-rich receptor-like protein kinase PERK8 isoform X2 n=1 Tax=Phragmites australis TaxID=29695 RepID=UPI002D7A2B71|nr:proline-rich receptor-like protein kinase PERK8 isoform X2 [Phragmites australis]
MASTPPPPVIGKSGNLTVFITPPAVTPSPGPETPQSEFSTPPTSPRAVESPASPTPEQPASTPASVRMASPPPPTVTVSTPPLLKTVSPPLPAEKLTRAPPVQVPPPQFEKASAGPDGSVLSFLWDAVARVQEAHASLDKYISNWFGLDQSKYQWALNNYYERTGQDNA